MNTAQIIHAQVDKRAVALGEAEAATPLTVQQVLGQVALIQQIMKATMKEGEHYGRIPGCGNKPSLLKPGAEKLCLTFRLAPMYDVQERQLERGHREYRITATLTSILSGVHVGQGVGSCSTLENKYRYRAGAAEITDRAVPRAYWDIRQDDPAKAQELIGGAGYTVKKVDGQGWMVARGGEKVETDNPADTYNTVLKMGKKRALVDAVLTATAASDIFTQDLEDISANLATMTPATAPSASPDAAKAAPASVPSLPIPAEESATAPQPETVQVEAMDFRLTPIHFGKNRGLTLAELTPQQLHWYEKEWMVKKEVEGTTTQGDLTLINGLKAYRSWRETEKAQSPRKPQRAK